MKLKLRLKAPDYGDAAVRLQPLLRKTGDTAAARLLRAVADLPEEPVRQLMAAIPEQEKNEILSALAGEHQDQILERLQQFVTRSGLGITLTAVEVTPRLELLVQIGGVDYGVLAECLMPRLRKVEGYPVLKMLSAMPRPLWQSVLRRFPKEKLDETAVSLLNRSGDQICRSLTEKLNRQGIRGQFTDFSAAL